MIAIVIVGALILGTILRGFVLSYLWTWFMVPLGITEIGVAWAIGIAALVAMIVPTSSSSKEREIPEIIVEFLVSPFIVLLFGWIVHSFM